MLNPQERFELFIVATLMANEQNRPDLEKLFKEAAVRAVPAMRKFQQQTERAARRGTIRRVASQSGQYR